MIRLRRLGFLGAVWTAVVLSLALSLYLRSVSGEVALAPGWFWMTVGAIPIWTAVTPPILALSRRLPIERRAWPLAVLGHLGALVVILALDGLAGLAISTWVGGRRLTLWQEIARYSFVD